ncbi:DUF418 domain-containing protein [Brevibacterium oceani]|uniref:DUF418 domain-containing protein n=1 Tax=Brevibacterium oceani TaxID=358099 RepID=UPI002159D487|nr:DUF418 domain-containing protein [Brevibacterium oceani]
MKTTPQTIDSPPRRRSRIVALDVVRGFALCGILLVNLPPMFDLGVDGQAMDFYRVYEDVVQNRFFPIFSFLFGIGFGLMWLSATERSPRPRLALLRRFAFLAVIGGLHQLLQPGEALLPYAVVGIVVLLPTTWIPKRWLTISTGILGAILLVAAIMTGGGITTIPGLFLLGLATGCSGLIRRALDHPGRLALLGSVTAVISVAGFLVTDYEARQINQWINAGLGITMAFTYVVIVVLLLRTPAEVVLRPVLSPLGRMALSNYVGATLLIVAVRAATPDLSRFDSHGGYLAGLIISIGILTLQVIVSALWLRFFGQGPLEKLWRYVTWGPNRESVAA